MATNFPGSQDSFTNPTSSDTLDSPDHAAQHANVNDAVEAIELALLDGAPLHIDDTNERVGIGTTSPGYKLTVSGNGYFTGDFTVDQYNPSDAVFHVDSTDNRVGIGTTNPTYTLDVQDSTAAIASINDTGGTVGAATNSRVIFEANGSTAGEVGFLNTGAGIMSLKNEDGQIYLTTASADDILFRPNATEAMRVTSSGTVEFQAGSASAPSITFDGDTNTGIYKSNTNVLAFTTAGSIRALIYSGGIRNYADGSASTPAFHFGSDLDTGVYLRSTGQLAFANAGVESYMTTAGFYLASNDWFRAQGNGGFFFQTHGGGWQMTDSTYVRIYNTKSLYLSNEIFVPNMDGTSSYNTVRFNSSTGQLMRFTSITEIKEDITSIKPMMEYLNERSYLYDLRPVLYHEKDKADGTNNTRREYISGFVAEEVLDVAPELAYYDINGELQSYSNDGMIPHIVAELQRLMPMVEELYGDANPDWVAPVARPDDRKTAERELYDEASAAQALIGDPNANPLDGQQHFEDGEEE